MIIDQAFPEYGQRLQRSRLIHSVLIMVWTVLLWVVLGYFNIDQQAGLKTTIIVIPCFALILIPVSLWHKKRMRVILRAQDHDDLFCTRCAYPMDQIVDASVCPECGRPWVGFAAKQEWEYFRRANSKKTRRASW